MGPETRAPRGLRRIEPAGFGALVAAAAIAFGVAVGTGAAASAARAASPAPEARTARSGRPDVAVLHLKDIVGPATSRYITRGLATAQAEGDQLAILEMDTPGGLDTAMRDIIHAILASRIPVVGFVAPPGARAASAGTYILYACHVAAMAPATNLGAATPIEIGGSSTPQREPEPAAPTPGRGPSGAASSPSSESRNLTTEERKQINDAVAYIRSLAELRGRNADWAEQAVRGAASLPANAALQQHVIDLVASDIPDLLAKLDGRQVKVGGQTLVLATRGDATVDITPDWRTQLLAIITHPTIAYGLLLIGIYGLLLEGYNPGAMLPGVVGVISLLIALFAFQILSVNFAGLLLVALGIGMIIGEFFFPTYGSLGIGGLIAFVVGSIILFDTDANELHLALPVIAGVATAGGIILIGLVYVTTRSMRRPVVTGKEAMIGAPAEAFEDFEHRGRVRLGGELWNAYTSRPLRAGEPVRIVRVDGLQLWVEPGVAPNLEPASGRPEREHRPGE
ncbi:MAG TPA: nodulation protein NfeD [Steroidobacteraceae bacterium]|nr:nodulation protein NfeD [Steroidobacteraceae bacterium]